MAEVHITLKTDGMQEVSVKIPVYRPIGELSEDDRAFLLTEFAAMASDAIKLLAKSKPWMHEWETRAA